MNRILTLAVAASLVFYFWSAEKSRALADAGLVPLVDETVDPDRFTRRPELDYLFDWNQKIPDKAPPVDNAGSLTREEHWRRFDDPETFAPEIRPGKQGPGGSDFDGVYRSFLKTSEKAIARGQPDHDAAIAAVLEDARTGPDRVDQHLQWVIFIKKFSQKYRPEEGTAALHRAYEGLLEIKFGR